MSTPSTPDNGNGAHRPLDMNSPTVKIEPSSPTTGDSIGMASINVPGTLPDAQRPLKLGSTIKVESSSPTTGDSIGMASMDLQGTMSGAPTTDNCVGIASTDAKGTLSTTSENCQSNNGQQFPSANELDLTFAEIAPWERLQGRCKNPSDDDVGFASMKSPLAEPAGTPSALRRPSIAGFLPDSPDSKDGAALAAAPSPAQAPDTPHSRPETTFVIPAYIVAAKERLMIKTPPRKPEEPPRKWEGEELESLFVRTPTPIPEPTVKVEREDSFSVKSQTPVPEPTVKVESEESLCGRTPTPEPAPAKRSKIPRRSAMAFNAESAMGRAISRPKREAAAAASPRHHRVTRSRAKARSPPDSRRTALTGGRFKRGAAAAASLPRQRVTRSMGKLMSPPASGAPNASTRGRKAAATSANRAHDGASTRTSVSRGRTATRSPPKTQTTSGTTSGGRLGLKIKISPFWRARFRNRKAAAAAKKVDADQKKTDTGSGRYGPLSPLRANRGESAPSFPTREIRKPTSGGVQATSPDKPRRGQSNPTPRGREATVMSPTRARAARRPASRGLPAAYSPPQTRAKSGKSKTDSGAIAPLKARRGQPFSANRSRGAAATGTPAQPRRAVPAAAALTPATATGSTRVVTPKTPAAPGKQKKAARAQDFVTPAAPTTTPTKRPVTRSVAARSTTTASEALTKTLAGAGRRPTTRSTTNGATPATDTSKDRAAARKTRK